METVIEQQVVDSFVESFPDKSQQDACEAAVRRLQQLSLSNSSLSDFLSAFATTVADLYAANSVSVWFQSPASSKSRCKLQRKVSVGGKNLLFDSDTEQAHDQLLCFAIEHKHAFAALPFSAPSTSTPIATGSLRVSNPTDSHLLLVPVQFEEQDIAVLEIGLGPKPLRHPHRVLMASYLEWLNWLSGLLQRGIERRFAATDQRLVSALGTLQQTSLDVEKIQNQIRLHIERALQSLAGQNFGSLSANRAVAKQVHNLLDGKGLRVCCPECGQPAILRCQNAGNSKTGVFTYDHYLELGRTFHGGQSTFPKLHVVPKPPRRKAK